MRESSVRVRAEMCIPCHWREKQGKGEVAILPSISQPDPFSPSIACRKTKPRRNPFYPCRGASPSPGFPPVLSEPRHLGAPFAHVHYASRARKAAGPQPLAANQIHMRLRL
jgi:hypothetical protein